MEFKRIFSRWIRPAYLAPVLILILLAVVVEPNWIEVKQQKIVNKELARILSGKKIVLISDLHIREIGYREKSLINKINDIEPDIVFIAGEFTGRGKKIDDYKVMVSNASKVLKKIQSKYGIYAVLGEGDMYGFSSRELLLRQALKDVGVIVVSNEIVEIDLDSKKLSLIGLGVSLAGIKKLFTNINQPVHPSILLSHRPDFFMSGVDALEVNLAEHTEIESYEWGWQDNAYWSNERAEIYFDRDGQHTVRISRRQDGVAIDQILLTPDKVTSQGLSDLDQNSCYRKHDNDILITTNDIIKSSIIGNWSKDNDASACNNLMITDMPDLNNVTDVPFASPENYFEATFDANRGVKYHVWLRMKANKARTSSDSIYLQFSDSLDTSGKARYQIDRTLKDIYDVDVILSGDTHGGQVRFPYSVELMNLFGANIKYDQGLFELGFTTLYVNRGIGWSNIPMRLFCRPEITQLNFVSQ